MIVVLWVWVTGGRNRLIPPSSPNIYIFVGSNSMNIKHLITFSAAALLLATPVIAKAQSSAVNTPGVLVGQISKKLKELKKFPRNRVKSALRAEAAKSRGLADSDGDRVPDAFENVSGSNACDIDSDDDGIPDGDDKKPGDSSSAEIEIKNTISAITGTTVTVGDYTFTINDSTVYRDGSSLSYYAVGNLVEVKGRITGDTLFLRSIKKDDD